MADKITTVQKSRIGSLVGVLGEDEVARLSGAVALFLDLGHR